MTQKAIVRHSIEIIYGPCPLNDFLKANDWANSIDWEKVKAAVDEEHPEFEWTHPHPQDMDVAQSMIFEVRHEMLRHAGHESGQSCEE